MLDALHCVHASLLLGSPEPDTVVQLWSHLCSGERKGHRLNLLLRVGTSSAASTQTLFCSCRSEKELFFCRCKSQASTSWVSPFLKPASADLSCPSFGRAPPLGDVMVPSARLLPAESPSCPGPRLRKRPAEMRPPSAPRAEPPACRCGRLGGGGGRALWCSATTTGPVDASLRSRDFSWIFLQKPLLRALRSGLACLSPHLLKRCQTPLPAEGRLKL